MVNKFLLLILLLLPLQLCAQQESDSINYAISLLSGLKGRIDTNKGYHLLKEYAEQGNPDALNGLGICYLKGLGTEQNEQMAYSCFQEASQQKCGKAWYNLGHIHANKQSSYYDLDEARYCFLQAIENGCFSALYSAGCCYYYSSPADYAESFNLFKQGASYLSPECMYMLGLCYMYGNGTSQDLFTAEEWLENARLYGCVEANAKIQELRDMSIPEDALNLQIQECKVNGLLQFSFTLSAETECEIAVSSCLHVEDCFTKSIGLCQQGENNCIVKTNLKSGVYAFCLRAGNNMSSQTFYVK